MIFIPGICPLYPLYIPGFMNAGGTEEAAGGTGEAAVRPIGGLFKTNTLTYP